MFVDKDKVYGLVPDLSHENCLTLENLKNSQVNLFSYSLARLLVRPGLEILSSLNCLSNFTGLETPYILNASMPTANKDFNYVLKSEYDGSIITVSKDQLLQLILRLRPPAVVLPVDSNHDFISAIVNNGIFPFISASFINNLINKFDFGVYFTIQANKLDQDNIQSLNNFVGKLRMVSTNMDFFDLKQLCNLGINIIETNKPILDAENGIVYTTSGPISIQDISMRINFNNIDEQCNCQTCSQKLTKAYLHHLFVHTPLLCHRFIAQHNIYFFQKFVTL